MNLAHGLHADDFIVASLRKKRTRMCCVLAELGKLCYTAS
jgi:hypothetical protein